MGYPVLPFWLGGYKLTSLCLLRRHVRISKLVSMDGLIAFYWRLGGREYCLHSRVSERCLAFSPGPNGL